MLYRGATTVGELRTALDGLDKAMPVLIFSQQGKKVQLHHLYDYGYTYDKAARCYHDVQYAKEKAITLI